MSQERCAISWCDRKILLKGFCAHHFLKFSRRKEGIDPSLPTKGGIVCAYHNCTRSAVKKWCKRHKYLAFRLKSYFVPPNFKYFTCIAPGCSRPVRNYQQVCQYHYNKVSVAA